MTNDRVVAQYIIFPSLTEEKRVRSQANPARIVLKEVALGQDFFF
jgi:hypothetical protein